MIVPWNYILSKTWTVSKGVSFHMTNGDEWSFSSSAMVFMSSHYIFSRNRTVHSPFNNFPEISSFLVLVSNSQPFPDFSAFLLPSEKPFFLLSSFLQRNPQVFSNSVVIHFFHHSLEGSGNSDLNHWQLKMTLSFKIKLQGERKTFHFILLVWQIKKIILQTFYIKAIQTF